MTPRRRHERHLDRWRTAVLHSNLPPQARLVALVLSRYMDLDHLGDARPGNKRLAVETGYSVRSVRRWLRHLEASGWILKVFEGRHVHEKKMTAIYRGTWPRRVDSVPPPSS